MKIVSCRRRKSSFSFVFINRDESRSTRRSKVANENEISFYHLFYQQKNDFLFSRSHSVVGLPRLPPAPPPAASPQGAAGPGLLAPPPPSPPPSTASSSFGTTRSRSSSSTSTSSGSLPSWGSIRGLPNFWRFTRSSMRKWRWHPRRFSLVFFCFVSFPVSLFLSLSLSLSLSISVCVSLCVSACFPIAYWLSFSLLPANERVAKKEKGTTKPLLPAKKKPNIKIEFKQKTISIADKPQPPLDKPDQNLTVCYNKMTTNQWNATVFSFEKVGRMLPSFTEFIQIYSLVQTDELIFLVDVTEYSIQFRFRMW